MCNMHSFPSDCENCNKSNNARCEQHIIVTCSNVDCAKPYHTECVASSLYHKLHNKVDFIKYTCMKCNATNIPGPNQQDTLADNNISNIHKKLERFGILHLDGEAIRTINKLKSALKKVSASNDYNVILNSNPNPYPTPI